MYIDALMKAAAASLTSSSSSSAWMDSYLPCGVLLDESCDSDEVFLSDGEKKRTLEEAADALVQISGMLVDAAQILHDCHEVRFMAISMCLLGLHLLQMLSENSFFEFITTSQTSYWPCRPCVSLHRSSYELYKAFEVFSFHRVKK